jgi:uncharacterized protein YuzE
MRVKSDFDPEQNVAYLYLDNPMTASRKTKRVNLIPGELADVIFDFNEDGHVIGMEFIGVTRLLPTHLIKKLAED